MTVDELDQKLMRPIFNLRMGRAIEDSNHPDKKRVAAGATKAANARIEIEEILYNYACEKGWVDVNYDAISDIV